jgi:predicted DNA-binding transcriptional regulator YafY
MTELAVKFGVSVRTIKRDIDELGYLIPIKTKFGRYEGGVYVMEDYKWDKAYMSDEDIALLVRIKEIAAVKQNVVLDEDDLQRLERLIVTYCMPKEK